MKIVKFLVEESTCDVSQNTLFLTDVSLQVFADQKTSLRINKYILAA